MEKSLYGIQFQKQIFHYDSSNIILNLGKSETTNFKLLKYQKKKFSSCLLPRVAYLNNNVIFLYSNS